MDNGVPASLPAAPAELVLADDQRPALRPRWEAFAQSYVTHGNAGRAYREAYTCSPDMKPATLRQRGYELAHHPAVAGRIRELYDQAAKDTTVSARARMVRLQEVCEADPGEIVRTVAESCRYCHGLSHQYMWRTQMEYATALIQAVAESAAMPSDAGGYGFDPHRPPHEDCPECHGYGFTRVVITPTDQLSPSARRLVKAVRQKSDGSVEVVMHDALAASDQLNRMQGVYVDRSISATVNLNVPPPKDWTPAESLAFLQSLKPAT